MNPQERRPRGAGQGALLDLRLDLSDTGRSEHLWTERVACRAEDLLTAQDRLRIATERHRRELEVCLEGSGVLDG